MANNPLAQTQPPPIRDMEGLPEPFVRWTQQQYNWNRQQSGSFTNLKFYNASATPHDLDPLTDGYVLATAVLINCNFNLPLAKVRKRFHIKKINSSAQSVNIAPQIGDTIQGAAFLSITAQYGSYTLYSDGANTWYIESST